MTNDYKMGDKVIITHTDKQDNFSVGDCAIITEVTEYNSVYRVKFIEGKMIGKYCLVGDYQMEKFISPKFKVNHKFKVEGKTFQIVKVALNKKHKSYTYLVYCLEHGCPAAVMEKDIPVAPVKMTLKQVEKALGKKIIITK